MNKNERNVGTVERVARVAGGTVAAVAGAYVLVIGSSLLLNGLAVAGIVLGLDFIYTGVTGYCPLYAKLRWSTAQAPSTKHQRRDATGTSGTHGDPVGSARVVLPVPDLACYGGDALAAERVIAKVPGVLHAYINPATENAYIDYDPESVTSAAIAAKVRDLGNGVNGSTR